MHACAALLAILAFFALIPRPTSAQADDKTEAAFRVLQQRCQLCHGGRPDLGTKDLGTNFRVSRNMPAPYVVPGNPGESRIWQRIERGEMPMLINIHPENKPLTSQDKRAIYDWLASLGGKGAKPSQALVRPAVDELRILQAIHGHLAKIPVEDRPYQRYFTLAHVHNDPDAAEEDLQLQRAALSKVANSLSWKEKVAVPRAIDPEQTVLTIDLRSFGWERQGLWEQILRAYPDGTSLDQSQDEAIREVASAVMDLSASALPYVRVDWFVYTAARPPLYHQILDLPKNTQELRSLLGVNAERNFFDGVLKRGGLIQSGVSSQNRVLDRHPAKYGAYWESYDFLQNDGRGSVAQFPLGPDFPGNNFRDQAFVATGGEMIFNLPNGLQAYYLANAKGQRIDEGPTAIVHDSLKVSGTPGIVAGLSCMSCHAKGMIPFQDRIGPVSSRLGFKEEVRRKIEQLYVPKKEMDQHLREDENRFLKALDTAIGPLVGAGVVLRDALAEPVRAVVQRYLQDPSAKQVALEVGARNPQALQDAIQQDPFLQLKGLATLTQDGGSVKRTLLDSQAAGISPFQDMAASLGKGYPLIQGIPTLRRPDSADFTVKLSLKTGSKIQARWLSPQGLYRTLSSVSQIEGERPVRFQISGPGGKWEPGSHRLEVYVDGNKSVERRFLVINSEERRAPVDQTVARRDAQQ